MEMGPKIPGGRDEQVRERISREQVFAFLDACTSAFQAHLDPVSQPDRKPPESPFNEIGALLWINKITPQEALRRAQVLRDQLGLAVDESLL